MLPSYDNCVTLEREEDGHSGASPIAHIRCALSENDRRLVVRDRSKALREMTEHARLPGELHRLGARPRLGESLARTPSPVQPLRLPPWHRAEPRRWARPSTSAAARAWALTRATSVLNEVNQVWDVPNLFVTDGASFVSNSTVGPALTIMALAARACEFIAREHATGGLSGTTAPVS